MVVIRSCWIFAQTVNEDVFISILEDLCKGAQYHLNSLEFQKPDNAPVDLVTGCQEVTFQADSSVSYHLLTSRAPHSRSSMSFLDLVGLQWEGDASMSPTIVASVGTS